MDVTPAEAKASYGEMMDYVFQQTDFEVSCLYIAQVKAKHGILERESFHVTLPTHSHSPDRSLF